MNISLSLSLSVNHDFRLCLMILGDDMTRWREFRWFWMILDDLRWESRECLPFKPSMNNYTAIKPQSAPAKEGGLKSHRNTFGPWPLPCLCSTLFNLPCWIMLDCNVAPFTPMTCLQLKLTTALYTELPWWSNMRARLRNTFPDIFAAEEWVILIEPCVMSKGHS